jgi:hypothetical protein
MHNLFYMGNRLRKAYLLAGNAASEAAFGFDSETGLQKDELSNY